MWYWWTAAVIAVGLWTFASILLNILSEEIAGTPSPNDLSIAGWLIFVAGIVCAICWPALFALLLWVPLFYALRGLLRKLVRKALKKDQPASADQDDED